MRGPLFKSLFRFVLVGGFVTALAYVGFIGLLKLGVHYLPASAGIWTCGVVLNYLLNRTFTFAHASRPGPREFATFVAGNILQLLLGLANYSILIGVMGFGPTLAFVCNTAVTACFGFVFMRLVVFTAQHAARSA